MPAHRHRTSAETLWANMSFNMTPIKTPTSAPSDGLSKMKAPIALIHGSLDRLCSFAQTKAVFDLAVAENWAPHAQLKMYTHSGGHMAPFECLDEWLACYRWALKDILAAPKHVE